jgi:tRNA-Thr(GGU) m(6)t(6)A37 methyltransferase TsaA
VPEPVSLVPIGYVRGPRKEPTDDAWGAVESVIAVDERFPVESLAGLDEFSHVEVIYLFHLADAGATTLGARRPRGLGHLPEVGVFAQRNKDRPNHLGVSRCALLGVAGREVRVRGLDAIDGTPVLDLKPYFTAFAPGRGAVREPMWVEEITGEYF